MSSSDRVREQLRNGPPRLIIGGMLVLAWFLANVVPFFGAAVDLLGASVTPSHSQFTCGTVEQF